MAIGIKNSEFFVVGSALPPDSPSYVERPEDDLLFNAVQAGNYCYVIAAPRLGKSSLIIHTAARLHKQQIVTAIVYLSGLNNEIGTEQWYLGLVTRLQFLLKLDIDVEDWWVKQKPSSLAQYFIDFLRLAASTKMRNVMPVVIFIDEIEAIGGSKAAAEFLAAIRSIYEARAVDSIFQRLTFVLSGTAIPTDLIEDAARSPFTIAQKVSLHDFNQEQASILQRGLIAAHPKQAEALFARIFYWTGGHPYLTQKLCLATTELNRWRGTDVQSNQIVDRLVEKLFLSPTGQNDIDLLFIRESITTHARRRRLLAIYRRVYEGQVVRVDETSTDQNRLKFIGLARDDEGLLKVRNLIYRQVFNLNWLKTISALSVNWLRYTVIGLIVLTLTITLIMSFLIYNQVQTVVDTQTQSLLDGFDEAANPNGHLTNLAGLFELSGRQDKARELFFQKLDSEGRLAMFKQVDPHKAGSALIAVIKGVYTDSALQDTEQDNTLLQAMAQTMRALMDDPAYPDAVSLELEITQWLKGRDLYHQGQYRQAINSYYLALALNNNNPGVHFDRGLAYAALGQPEQALPEFALTLDLDESWQTRVQQVLLSDSQIYGALWAEFGSYQELAALVPTPTPSPIPTDIPAPTFTPLATPTLTPYPPTATPTSTPTRIPILGTPVSSPAPTVTLPTANPPTGTFTLLKPILSDEPSYGPTTFEWEWSGSLPAEYGFEVRVWKEGTQPAGAHNAVLDNQNGNIKSLGNNTYRLQIDIKEAAGVRNAGGVYLWTVALVKISPKYVDLGQQAPPANLRFAASGRSDSDKGDGGKSDGGGVGID